jgi:hypothetical protein
VTSPREEASPWADALDFSRTAFTKLPFPVRRSILHALGKYAPWEEGFDPTPPRPQGNEKTGAPDFVGIGAQKAGTSWWYTLVCAHPDVYTRDDIHKERHFFGRYATRSFGPEDCSLYHDWFPRPPGSIMGEWTPDYLHLPWVPPLLARAAPQARLLVLLRDPVDRFCSGLAHYYRDGRGSSVDPIQIAIARGFYHETLCHWLAYFSPEQVMVLQYERCVADPIGELGRTYRFLGLDPFVPPELRARVNTTENTLEMDEDARRRLADLYAADVAALFARFPDLDPSLWPNFSSTIAR